MARRGNGEGSLYRRADGKWVAAATVRIDGHNTRVVGYGRTRQDAREKLEAVQSRVRAGQPAKDDTATLDAYLQRWLIDGVGDLKPATRELYATLVRVHITPVLGTRRLADLTPLEVQGLVTSKRLTHSDSTVRSIYAVLRRALEQAVQWELIARNPAAKVTRPKAGPPQTGFLSVEESSALLDAARGTRLHALVAVALAIGLRRGEALALRWSDIDLDAATVSVSRTLGRVGTQLQLSTPKSGKSRLLPLPQPLLPILRAHAQLQAAERLHASTMWDEHGLVFPSRIGTPQEPRNLLREYQRLVQQAGLPATRFHSLRHSCGSLLLAQGVHLAVIAEVLGHSGTRTTEAVYAHVTDALRRDAADRMGAAGVTW